jgi:hypothetical protein
MNIFFRVETAFVSRVISQDLQKERKKEWKKESPIIVE